MDAEALRRYLHEHIPLSAAMGVTVRSLTADAVTLDAPLAPNINHRATVFGGSAAAVGMLAAWGLLHARLRAAQPPGAALPQLVVQHSRIDFERPLAGDFVARATLAESAAWPRFAQMLERRGRARIAVQVRLGHAGEDCARLHGEFVALRAPGAGGERRGR